MDQVSFQSTITMAQASFVTWVRQRPSWDRNQYELLNGRIFMNPPASFPKTTGCSNWLVDCEAGQVTVFERRESAFDAGRCYEKNDRFDSAVLQTGFAVRDQFP